MNKLPTLEEFSDAMLENRFAFNEDVYPDEVTYNDSDDTIWISDAGNDVTINKILRMNDDNVFFVTLENDDEEYTVKFLSDGPINPFEN